MNRQGFSLPELLVSLVVLGVVLTLVAQMALGQLRFFRGTGEVIALDGRLHQVNALAALLLRDLSPSGGDVIVALDSAIEVHLPSGYAFTCDSGTGRVVIPAPEEGRMWSGFRNLPEEGDRVMALYEDSSGATWLTLHAYDSPTSTGSVCAAFPDARATWTVALREQVHVPARVALRFSRRSRIGHYRAGDGRWYVGFKDWNGSQQRFNTIQPMAGPLDAHSDDPSTSGFQLVYLDQGGMPMTPPVVPERIAAITVFARGRPMRPVPVGGAHRAMESAPDSESMVVSLRNFE